MIFTVVNKVSRQHLGIVNERTIREALASATQRYGKEYLRDTFRWVVVPIDLEVGDTQYGMELPE